jgi:hypothetical protein
MFRGTEFMSGMAIAGSRRSSTRQSSNWARFTDAWWARAGLSPALRRRLAKAQHPSAPHWTCKAPRRRSENLPLQDEYLPLLQIQPLSGTANGQVPCSRMPWITPLSAARSEQLSEYPKVYESSSCRSAQLSDAGVPTAVEGDSDAGPPLMTFQVVAAPSEHGGGLNYAGY